MDSEHFQTLIHKHLDDVMSAEERAEFEQMLLTSPQARTEFWKVAKQHAALRTWGESRNGQQRGTASQRHQSRPTRVMWALTGVAALAAVLVLSLISGWGDKPATVSPSELSQEDTSEEYQPENMPAEPPSRSVAVMRATPDVKWNAGSTALAVGDSLQPGWLHLQSGVVQLEFALGARVVLEGPAEFQLVSSGEAFLKSGKLRAFVPEPAQGFRINSPDCLVVDYGTEFGFSVGGTGASEVHVFKGKVEVQPDHDMSRKQMLTGDQAVKMATGGQLVAMSANSASFINEDELGRRRHENSRTAMERWRTGSDWLRQHRDTALYYDFQKTHEWSRTLVNQAVHGLPEAEATVVGCDWVNGRWPDKGALEFKRPGDRLRVSLPGKLMDFSLIAWVRVDSLPWLQNSLIMGDSFQPGETHWFLSREGNIGFGVRNVRNQWTSYKSPPIITPETRGSWVMLVTVYRGYEVNGTVNITHYVNGHTIGSIIQTGPHTLPDLGTFEIGNWAVKPDEPIWVQRGYKSRNPADHVRCLKGRIDEFAVMRGLLSDADVARLWESGRTE